MEDLVVQGFTQAIFEISEGSLTGDKPIADAGIDPVVLSFNGVVQHIKECFHIGVLFEVAEQFQQKETDRVIAEADETIGMGYNGAGKGEIYQRRDESGKPADNPAIRMDFDMPTLVFVF